MSVKTAIVTGGSRGIGFAVVKQLGGEGYRVAILDVNPKDSYKDNFAALDKAGVDYMYFQGSITAAEDREAFLAAAVEKYGDIDVLVNNAGVSPKIRRDMLEMTEESFDHVVGVILKGTMFMTQIVARQMLTQPMKGDKRATIVFVTSSNVTRTSPDRAEYCVAKCGASMLSRVYADRLAKDRILVYEIRPGVIDTEMTSVVHDKYTRMIEDGLFPIARWGVPEDCAKAVSAFCGDAFTYSTGSYIDVDGGFHLPHL